MRKLIALIFAVSLFYGNVALAADAPAVPPAKIGVVDMQTIAVECDAAKAFKEEMEKKYGKERNDLEKQGQAVKKQAEGLKNPKVSEDKKVAFIKAKQKLDQNTRNFMRKVEQEEVKFRQDMVSLVFSATYEVARAQGFNFVVDVTAGGVLYADQSMDLTKAVMDEVNKLYKENKAKQAAEPAKSDAKPSEGKK